MDVCHGQVLGYTERLWKGRRWREKEHDRIQNLVIWNKSDRLAVIDVEPLKLIEVVINLLKRDRAEDALNLQLDAFSLAIMNGLEIKDVMRMPIDDVAALSSPVQVPYVPQVEGYDKVWYGEGAFERRSY